MGGESQLTVLSAFTGIGGFDLGFEASGFDVLACIELDEVARKTLESNRPSWNLLQDGDLEQLAHTLGPADLGLQERELGILLGAPPCQPFSRAAGWSIRGNRGLEDVRSSCIHSFLDVAAKFLPRLIVMENVPGFVHGPTSAINSIQDRLNRINDQTGTQYIFDFRVLDAADFGVPQHRRRAILIAHREGLRINWPLPTHDRWRVTAWDALYDLDTTRNPQTKGRWAGLLPSIPEGWNYQWHTNRGGGLPLFGYRTRYWSFLLKLAKNMPAWTLAAQPGPSTGPFHWSNRPLTTQEMLRLQTFPRDFKVTGTPREQTRQVGNATPPLLAERLARQLAVDFFDHVPEGLVYTVRRKRTRPRRSPTRDVPEDYLALVKDHPDHPGPGRGPAPLHSEQQAASR